MLVHLEPLLGIYTDMVRYYVGASLAAHRSTGKLLSVLASIFTELAQKVQTQQTHPHLNKRTRYITGYIGTSETSCVYE